MTPDNHAEKGTADHHGSPGGKGQEGSHAWLPAIESLVSAQTTRPIQTRTATNPRRDLDFPRRTMSGIVSKTAMMLMIGCMNRECRYKTVRCTETIATAGHLNAIKQLGVDSEVKLELRLNN